MTPYKKIYLSGEINDENFSIFSKELTELENDGEENVCIELSSGGGDAYAALAFFDRIRISTCSITIVAFGQVASAAVLILAAGKRRIIAPSSWVMVHEDSPEVEGLSVHEAERVVRHHRRLENQWNALLAKTTKTSANRWGRLHKKETFLTASECVTLGLADEILGVK
jgi:ATP-dependent Clp endopeptidase proteolytic subunit ClpP